MPHPTVVSHNCHTLRNLVANLFVCFKVYAALHLITMTCLPVIWVNAYVYQTEIFSPKWRYVFVGIYEMPFHYYVFCLIVYLNRTWTGIHLWVGIATGISLPIWFLIPESPRWLAQNNHVDEAMKVTNTYKPEVIAS